jgi:hypothetical protein
MAREVVTQEVPARATEIQLIPFGELATGQAAGIRNGARNAVVLQAARELRLAPTKLLVRDIDPLTDLDYSYASWHEKTGTTANVYETMSTGTMADMRYVGIYGVQDDSEAINVSKIKINVGGSDKAIWFLENLYSVNGGPRIGFSPSVVIIPQRKLYTISRYVLVASSPAPIVLKGFVVEAYGRLLSP